MIDDLSWHWAMRHGRAADLHDPAPPTQATRTVWDMRVSEPSLVLGSTQASEDVDAAAAAAAGIAVGRRRSGGGAVLLIPDEHLWLDVWLPAADPLWLDDVGRAADWLAAVWVRALRSLGTTDLHVQTGPLERGAWGRQVCFAGIGPAEVTVGGRKLVGISQRRTRDWVRFQCLVHERWDAATTFGLLTRPGAAVAGTDWADRVGTAEASPLRSAFTTALSAAAPAIETPVER